MIENSLSAIPDPDRMVAGQAYWRVRSEPYERKDGAMIELTVWMSFCAACGRRFDCRSVVPDGPGNRRCEAHRWPGVRVGSKKERKRLAEEAAEAWTLVGDAAQKVVNGLS
jgi:hypothetical protein